MHSRADFLIRRLGLEPHPEGGYFRETFRSTREVTTAPGTPGRPALTHIYFLLASGERSRWHRIAHEELWHFYEGDPLELTWLAPDLSAAERRQLSDAGEEREAVAAVPAGCWQAARATGYYSLVGCTTGPGFVWADLAIMADDAEATALLRARFPELTGLL